MAGQAGNVVHGERRSVGPITYASCDDTDGVRRRCGQKDFLACALLFYPENHFTFPRMENPSSEAFRSEHRPTAPPSYPSREPFGSRKPLAE